MEASISIDETILVRHLDMATTLAVPLVQLNSGNKMPVIGMGTATFPVPPDETVFSAVLEAIAIGYRHFDTASVYGSERPVGRAVAAALERGLIASREEIFITTKLWCTDAVDDRVVPALRESLRNLDLDYVDLFLIHFPVAMEGEKNMIFESDKIIPFNMKSVWKSMETCQNLGLAKSIGVSNFTCKKVVQLLEHATIIPAVNQVEMHILFGQKKLRELCSEKGIHVTAFSPLGGKGVIWGSNLVLECEEIKRIAKSMGRTIAQVCLRWVIEEGVSSVPKSFNSERLKENIDLFDWNLHEDDKELLIRLPQRRLILAEAFVRPDGLYKTVSEFWDYEM